MTQLEKLASLDATLLNEDPTHPVPPQTNEGILSGVYSLKSTQTTPQIYVLPDPTPLHIETPPLDGTLESL